MTMPEHAGRLLLLTLAIFAMNLPFGYWRAGTRKLSVAWFLSVHLPVPLIVLMRVASGVGFQLATLPFTLGAFALGQFLGGRLRTRRRGGAPSARL